MKRLATIATVVITATFGIVVATALAGDHPPEDHKVTICHVAGLASDPANYITLTIDEHAVYGPGGHFNENGTTQAGHEQDTFGECNPPPPVDVCPNLEGNQATVPPGYTLVEGQCVQVPQSLPLAAGVTFTEATCTSGPSFTLVKTTLPGIGSRPFYNVEGTLVDGKPVAGASYTITAIPVPGYTFTGQTVWNHTFAPAPTNCSTPPPPPPHVVTGSADVYCDLPSQTYILRGTVDGQAADSVSPATLPGGVRGTFNVTVTRGDTSFRTSVFVYGDCVKPTTTTTTTTTQSTTTPPPPPAPVTSSTTTTKPAAAKPPKQQTTSKPKAAKPPKADNPPVKLSGNPKKDKCKKMKNGLLNCGGQVVVPGSG